MDEEIAAQISCLLNSQNRLGRRYDAASVFDSRRRYLFELGESSQVIAAVEVVKVQWYQCEVRHLTVAPQARRQGYAKKLLRRAEDTAKELGARIVQCTIRRGNQESESLFARMGYMRAASFGNERTGNTIAVWQKALSREV